MTLLQYVPSPSPPSNTTSTNVSKRTYQGLSPRARLGVGFGLLAWGLIGLKLSDKAEEKLGYTPTEQDKAELDKMIPKIHSVPREKPSSSTSPTQ